MNEEQKEQIARFFYFAVSDSALAYASSVRVIEQILKSQKSYKPQDPESSSFPFDTEMVKFSHKIMNWLNSKKSQKNFVERLLKKFSSEKSSPQEFIWSSPPDLDISIWKKFRKESTQEEFLAVIWSKLLHIPDDNIAEALRVSVGTVRTRVGNGLRMLGRTSHV